MEKGAVESPKRGSPAPSAGDEIMKRHPARKKFLYPPEKNRSESKRRTERSHTPEEGAENNWEKEAQKREPRPQGREERQEKTATGGTNYRESERGGKINLCSGQWLRGNMACMNKRVEYSHNDKKERKAVGKTPGQKGRGEI